MEVLYAHFSYRLKKINVLLFDRIFPQLRRLFCLHNPVIGGIRLPLGEGDTPAGTAHGVVLDDGHKLMHLLELEERTVLGLIIGFPLTEILLGNLTLQLPDVDTVLLLANDLEEVFDALVVVERQVLGFLEVAVRLAGIEAILQCHRLSPPATYDDNPFFGVIIQPKGSDEQLKLFDEIVENHVGFLRLIRLEESQQFAPVGPEDSLRKFGGTHGVLGDVDELVVPIPVSSDQFLVIFELVAIDILRQLAFDINFESIVAGYQPIGNTVYILVVDVLLRLQREAFLRQSIVS